MKITGIWSTRVVRIDGRRLDPQRSQRLRNHSPDGFNWGYAGSGPAQLALAILLRAKVRTPYAIRLYQQFKFDIIARLPQQDFQIEVDVPAWIERALDAQLPCDRDGALQG